MTIFENNKEKEKSTLSAGKKIILYHASDRIIKEPQWDYADEDTPEININKDFGAGFYTSVEDEEYPVYLRCAYDELWLNKYEFNPEGLKILELKNDLKWLFTTAFHRSNFSGKKKYHKLRDEVRAFVTKFDLIIGTISDDNFYSAIDLFLNNAYTDYITIEIAQMLNFGIQYTLRSDKSCSQIKFIEAKQISKETINKYRVQKATDKEQMAEMVEDRRIRLRPLDNGRLFAEIVESGDIDVETWA